MISLDWHFFGSIFFLSTTFLSFSSIFTANVNTTDGRLIRSLVCSIWARTHTQVPLSPLSLIHLNRFKQMNSEWIWQSFTPISRISIPRQRLCVFIYPHFNLHDFPTRYQLEYIIEYESFRVCEWSETFPHPLVVREIEVWLFMCECVCLFADVVDDDDE